MKTSPQPTHHEGRLSLSQMTSSSAPHLAPLVGKRIQDLVSSIDPNYTIDAEAEEQVLQLADDFLDKVTRQAVRMSQHRGSKILDVQDIQLVLAKQWGITVPGLNLPNMRPLTRPGGAVKIPQSSSSHANSFAKASNAAAAAAAAAARAAGTQAAAALPVPAPTTTTKTATKRKSTGGGGTKKKANTASSAASSSAKAGATPAPAPGASPASVKTS